MVFLSKGIKQDLQHVATDVGFQVEENLKIIKLNNPIGAVDGFEEEFVKGYLNSVIKESEKKEDGLRKVAWCKQEIEFELEKCGLKTKKFPKTVIREGFKLKLMENSVCSCRISYRNSIPRYAITLFT